MSICCRSEVLFSSMRDSATGGGVGGGSGIALGAEAAAVMGASGGGVASERMMGNLLRDSLIVGATDSLILGEEGGCGDFSYSEQVKVNKNNYTLTFSGGGPNSGSMFGSMMTSSTAAPGDILADIRPPFRMITGHNTGTENCSFDCMSGASLSPLIGKAAFRPEIGIRTSGSHYAKLLLLSLGPPPLFEPFPKLPLNTIRFAAVQMEQLEGYFLLGNPARQKSIM
jgi:hypothetical protein